MLNNLINQFFFLAFLVVFHVGDIKEGLEDLNLLLVLEQIPILQFWILALTLNSIRRYSHGVVI